MSLDVFLSGNLSTDLTVYHASVIHFCLPSLSVCMSIYLSIYLSMFGSLLDLRRFFSFLILYTVGSPPRTGDRPVTRQLPTHRTAQTQ
jgi:hypothetical protein